MVLAVSILATASGCKAAVETSSTAPAGPNNAVPSHPAWLVTTHSGNDVLGIDRDGQIGTPLVAPKSGGLEGARGFTIGPGGDLFVACSQNAKSQILRYSISGEFKVVFAQGGGLVHPYEPAFGPEGDLYVTGQDNDAVFRYDGATGAFKSVFVAANSGGLKNVRGLTFGPDKNLYVASRDTHAVLRFDGKTGALIDSFVAPSSGGLARPIQVHFGPDGNLYVGSLGLHAVLRYDGKTGKFIDTFVAAKSGGLNAPSGFAFSKVDGDFYVASRLSSQILRYDGKTGAFKSIFVPTAPELENPEYLLPWPE